MKDKAKELVERFKKHAVGSLTSELIDKFNEVHPNHPKGISKWKALWDFAKLERAKQCALICVDEKIKTNRTYLHTPLGERKDNELKELKKEIEKL